MKIKAFIYTLGFCSILLVAVLTLYNFIQLCGAVDGIILFALILLFIYSTYRLILYYISHEQGK
jgi:hypothetical protein